MPEGHKIIRNVYKISLKKTHLLKKKEKEKQVQ